MIYSYPNYYNNFKCVASKCKDTCCSAWQIVIDDDSLTGYENYEGEYKKTLCRNISWEEGVFNHNDKGTCAFLRDDMLCDMYIHMGKDSLCKTCREYPRHTEEFENLREISLSISCPEVARMLINTTDKVTFYTREDDEEEVFEDFDYFMFSNLEDIREEIISVIQNRDTSLRDRIDRILQIGASAQRHYEEGELILWSECDDEDRVASKSEYKLLMKQFSFLLDELELLYSNWEDVLIETAELVFSRGEAEFLLNRQEFIKWWEKSSLTPMDILLEQIIVYFISIYFLGAVYDENIIGKVDAGISHSIEIFILLLGRWIKNEERLDMDDVVEIVYRYSREIEHSDENLERVEIINWFDRK